MTDELNRTSREFRDRLFALLREYNVEMEIIEDTSGYYTECTGVNFFSYDEYDDNGDMIRSGVNLNIGRWEDGNNA
jgi:hypothetical protein